SPRRPVYLDVLSLAEMPWLCYHAIVAEHRGFQISSEACRKASIRIHSNSPWFDRYGSLNSI
ncbi:hypothetical protein BGX30_008625, partial [Mortierella sp. GBA39]